MRWRPAPAAATLAVTIVAIAAALHRGVVPNQSLLAYGGVDGATLARGEWWRLVTSQFLHVYAAHAVFNAAALLVAGSMLERIVGPVRFLALFLISGIAGQLVAVAMAPAIVASGASQAALGICAAMIAAALRARRGGRIVVPAAYVLAQATLDLLYAYQIKLPHVASFIVGGATGIRMLPPKKRWPDTKSETSRTIS